jgi:cyclopropane fatty-acyl-phospholipid synthase-like methyltransferase
MALGFPIEFVSKVRCKTDGAALELDGNCQLNEKDCVIRHGTLRCTTCGAAFVIDDGILNMLNEKAMHNESKHYQRIQNEHTARSIKSTGSVWWENEHNAMEMIPTLEALCVSQDHTILELGCGDGRYTVQLARQCQWIVAIDFSIDSLRVLQQRLQGIKNVGLVLADITTMKVTAGFDRVFSTLVSNLPTREYRAAMYHLAASVLKPDGRFVFSAHNFGFRQKLMGEAKSGRYSEGGIYRYKFTASECTAEVRQYFTKTNVRPIQIYLPFARTLRLPVIALSRFLERVPLINVLGELILCSAEHPVLYDSNLKP